MKHFSRVFVSSLVIVMTWGLAPAANLQAQDAITVHLSFPFTVGKQSIPSGTYQFSLESSQFLLSVRNVKTGDMETFDVRPEQQSTFEQNGHLLFRSSADRRILAEVHFPGLNTFSELIQQQSDRKVETLRASTGKRRQNAECTVQHALNRTE